MRRSSIVLTLCALLAHCALLCAQPRLGQSGIAQLRLRIASSKSGKHYSVPAVAWLHPLPGTPALPFAPAGPYVLLQKNRTFLPHFQVVPVGSVVQFPNADPFFHNVFSLFDGKRFDLGLYEAGSSKSVPFTREGISYIFCNIHPEMSAVIISLSTPTYGIADANGNIDITNIPPGNYQLGLWVEGVPHSVLVELERRVHVATGTTDLGEITVPIPSESATHTNKFGAPYSKDSAQPY